MAVETLELRANSGQIRAAEKDLDRLAASGGRAEKATNALRRAFAGLSAGVLASQIVRTADAYTNLENRLRVVTETSEELASTQQALLDVANRSRTDLGATVDLYATLARSTEDLNVSGERLQRITETIGKSFALSGADAQSAAGAIRQLGQGLASGALRGDEFNSVAEQAPEIMRAIAKETGLTRGELRDFAADGQITTELLIRSLENYEEAVDSAFGETTRTLSQSLQEASNNATQFIGSSEAVQSVVKAAGDAVVFLSENLGTITTVAQTLAAVLATRLVVSIASTTAGFVASQVQALRYQAALARMAGASVTATAATTALRGALALLGGPAGAVILATGALVSFVASSSDASDELEKLKQKTDQAVQGFANLSRFQLETKILGITSEIEKQTEKLAELERNFDEAYGDGVGFIENATGAYKEASEEVRKQSAVVASLRRELREAQGALNSVSEAEKNLARNATVQLTKEQQKSVSSIESLTLSLERQRESAGKSASAMVILNTEYKIADERSKLLAKGVDESVVAAFDRQAERARAAARATAEAVRAANAQEAPSRTGVGAGEDLARAQATTASLQAEYQNRLKVDQAYNEARLAGQQGYFAQERALIEANQIEQETNALARFEEEQARVAEQRALALENAGLNLSERLLLVTTFAQQELLNKQNLEANLTDIERQASAERTELARAERDAKIGIYASLAQSGLKIASEFAGKSFKVQKAFGIAESIISITAGVAKALNNPYPANLGFAAQVAAQGAALISKLKSTKPSAGGSISSVGGSSGAGGGATPAQGPELEQQNQRRVVDIQINDDAVLTGSSVKSLLADLLSSDDDVVVAVNNGQSQGQRTGLIPAGG
jgi:tape measure domain-containing protein